MSTPMTPPEGQPPAEQRWALEDAPAAPVADGLLDGPTPPPTAAPPAAGSVAADGPVAAVPVAAASHRHGAERGRRLPALVLPIVLAVLAAAVGAAAIVQVLRVHHDEAVAQARLRAVVAARGAVTAVLSYDYHNLSSDFAGAEKLLTPAFRRQYVATTKALTPTARQYKAVVSAQVTAAGVTTATDTTANVLLFVDQVSTNTKHSQPLSSQSRVEASLQYVQGRWLLSGLNAI